MLRWVLAFLILAIATGIVTFEGPAGLTMLAQVLFVVFTALLLIFLVGCLIDQAERSRDLD